MHNQGLRPRGDLSERDPRILEHPQLLAEMSVHDNPAYTGTPGLAGTTGTSASEPILLHLILKLLQIITV